MAITVCSIPDCRYCPALRSECPDRDASNCPNWIGKDDKLKLQPTFDRVAIIREPKEQVSKGGIVLPKNAKEESNYGEVVAVGPGGFNDDGSRREMGIKVGDIVFFGDYHMTTTGSKVVIVDEEDILAIVKNENEHKHYWKTVTESSDRGIHLRNQQCSCGSTRTVDETRHEIDK